MRRFFCQYCGASRILASRCLLRGQTGMSPFSPPDIRRPARFPFQLRGHLGLEALEVANDLSCLLRLLAIRSARGPAGTSRTGSSVAVRCSSSAPRSPRRSAAGGSAQPGRTRHGRPWRRARANAKRRSAFGIAAASSSRNARLTSRPNCARLDGDQRLQVGKASRGGACAHMRTLARA